VRFKVLTPNFAEYGAQVIKELEAFAATVPGWTIVPNNYEGIRVSCDKEHGDGWFLLRLSLHDPVLPLNFQSDSIGGVAKMAKELHQFASKFDQLDISPLKQFF